MHEEGSKGGCSSAVADPDFVVGGGGGGGGVERSETEKKFFSP